MVETEVRSVTIVGFEEWKGVGSRGMQVEKQGNRFSPKAF